MDRGFDIGEVFSFGWKTFKKRPIFLIAVALISSIVLFTFSSINQGCWSALYAPATNPPEVPRFHSIIIPPEFCLSFIFWCFYLIVSVIISMGVLNIYLRLAQGKPTGFHDLLSPIPRFFPYLFGHLFYALIVIAGLILLVFPAFIWALQFFLFSYAVIDQEKGPIEALKTSSRITYGYKWRLLGFCILAYFLNILGFIAFGVGVFVTWPVAGLAAARIYVQLKDNA